jgi:hypothetical protein
MHDGRRRVFPWLLAVVACIAIDACRRSDPERELRAAIASMAEAIERRTPADFLQHLADDFTRESSAFGKADARRVLAGLLLRNQKVSVTPSSLR